MLYLKQKIKRRASHPITDRKPSNTTTKILLIKSTVSKESHNSMAKITIMHMIFKNKLIIYITSAGFIPPQLEYPSFGELEIYLVGKMYGGGGYVWISYYLCAVEMLSLYTIDYC